MHFREVSGLVKVSLKKYAALQIKVLREDQIQGNVQGAEQCVVFATDLHYIDSLH